ncbi:hypothetical protein V8C26DRAFT_187769 [Trichoderma gracile]
MIKVTFFFLGGGHACLGFFLYPFPFFSFFFFSCRYVTTSEQRDDDELVFTSRGTGRDGEDKKWTLSFSLGRISARCQLVFLSLLPSRFRVRSYPPDCAHLSVGKGFAATSTFAMMDAQTRDEGGKGFVQRGQPVSGFEEEEKKKMTNL